MRFRILVLALVGCGGASGSAVITSGSYDLYFGTTGPRAPLVSFQIGLSDGYSLTGGSIVGGLLAMPIFPESTGRLYD
jgi:hypothetical protein